MVILAVLGPAGEQVINTLKAAAARFRDREAGKMLKRDILRMALKIKICIDEGLITAVRCARRSRARGGHARLTRERTGAAAARGAAAQRPVHVPHSPAGDQPPYEHAPSVVERPRLTRSPGDPPIPLLARKMGETREVALRLLGPHMQPKNVDALRAMFDFVGSEAFLAALLCAPAYIAERDALTRHLGEVLQPLVVEAESTGRLAAPCVFVNCKERRAEAVGGAVFSSYRRGAS
jgi:hypothetical protein